MRIFWFKDFCTTRSLKCTDLICLSFPRSIKGKQIKPLVTHCPFMILSDNSASCFGHSAKYLFTDSLWADPRAASNADFLKAFRVHIFSSRPCILRNSFLLSSRFFFLRWYLLSCLSALVIIWKLVRVTEYPKVYDTIIRIGQQACNRERYHHPAMQEASAWSHPRTYLRCISHRRYISSFQYIASHFSSQLTFFLAYLL